ncbi:transposase, IS4, partial [mine drainage metagenome]
TKDAFLTCLDRVCGEDPDMGGLVDRTERLDEELFRAWRERHPLPVGEGEVFAYALTSVLFFGVTCPLAELGYNARETKDQLQVNLALLVTRRERQPVTHAVFEGSRHGAATVRNFLVRVVRLGQRDEEKGLVPKGGTLIWDRGVVSKDHVEAVEAAGWKLVCGLPKTLGVVKEVLDRVEVPWRPETVVRVTKTTTIYAVETEADVYGKRRRLVVYTNMARAQRERDQRNEALAEIGGKLDTLAKEGAQWKEAKLHEKIGEIVGRWGEFLEIRVRRRGEGPRVACRLHQQALRAAERGDGKWVLLATDPERTV